MTETTQYQDLQELARELAVVDLTNSTVVQRLATEHYPYAVSVARDDTVYVSAWGRKERLGIRLQPNGQLSYSGRIGVGRHPSAMALNRSGSKLFVALGRVQPSQPKDASKAIEADATHRSAV